MLTELAVRDLGVITELTLLLGPGMTALTGETGAGKTLVVGAIDLLCGGRADATLVRAGAAAAEVSGRFVVGDDEIVVRRVVPRDGRSRAYVDGQLATVASLAEVGGCRSGGSCVAGSSSPSRRPRCRRGTRSRCFRARPFR
jgi:DNA repair protein RecN (Recombination protein N)